MRRSFLARAIAVAVGIAPLLATAQDSARPTRVVVQVSEADPARWNLVLNNVRNLQEELGADKVVIEIVAYGPGIGMLKFDAPTNSRVFEAIKSGVAVQACENTMRNQKLVRADMHPSVSYVPAGVVQIIKRQQEGWAYLRP
jgi:intracellular sulfur oxidation DsrE/DsrF family protein